MAAIQGQTPDYLVRVKISGADFLIRVTISGSRSVVPDMLLVTKSTVVFDKHYHSKMMREMAEKKVTTGFEKFQYHCVQESDINPLVTFPEPIFKLSFGRPFGGKRAARN